MCLAPIILLGYLFMLQPNASHVSDLSGAVLQGQTCESGPGLDAKVTTSGMQAVAAQYGFAYTHEQWGFVLTPKAGVAFLPRHVPELTSTVNFSLGLQGTIRYDRVNVSAEYWHQSNAGLGSTNAGLDMLAVMGGWTF
jgi:hypothetical protein